LPVSEVWAPPPAEPPNAGRQILHVEEERAGAASGRQLALAPLGNLARLFAILAADGERQSPQPLLGDFRAALETVAVIALLEARQRVVDLRERLGLHLHQGKLNIFLD